MRQGSDLGAAYPVVGEPAHYPPTLGPLQVLLEARLPGAEPPACGREGDWRSQPWGPDRVLPPRVQRASTTAPAPDPSARAPGWPDSVLRHSRFLLSPPPAVPYRPALAPTVAAPAPRAGAPPIPPDRGHSEWPLRPPHTGCPEAERRRAALPIGPGAAGSENGTAGLPGSAPPW